MKGSAVRKEKVIGEVKDKKKSQDILKVLFNKNSSVDLFQDITFHGKPMYEQQPILMRVKNKVTRNQIDRQLRKLILISQLKSIDRLLLINARLKIYSLIKWLFIHDVSFGQEVYIPE